MQTKSVVLVLALGFWGGCGPPGPPGERGPTGAADPTLLLLSPSSLFAARLAMIQVAGANTHFDATTTIDFDDPGVRATKIEVGSAGNLRVFVQTTETARLAPHNVTVTTPLTSGDEHARLQGGLTVTASLLSDATGNSGTVQQGGLADFALSNLDASEPFPSTPNVTSGPLLLSISTATSSQVAGTLLIDALAPVGPLALTLSARDAQGRLISFIGDPADPQAPKIAARPAAALEPGAPRIGESIAVERATNLYKIGGREGDQVGMLLFTALGSRLAPTGLRGAVAPSSGRFGDGRLVLPTQDTTASGASAAAPVLLDEQGTYLTVGARDSTGGATGYGYDAAVRLLPTKSIASLKEPATPDAAGRPLVDIAVLDAAYVGQDGAIDTAGDADFVRFKSAGAGRIIVQASGIGQLVPTVTLMQSNCTTQLGSSRQVQQELAASANTTYCARISGSVQSYQVIVAPL